MATARADDTPSSLDFALALARLGLSVIPVPRPRPGAAKGSPGDGKVPSIAWKRYQTARPTEAELRAWFATEQNLAVVTGAVSGVVVVDADSPEAVSWVKRNMLRTPWRVRTARGLHLYYRHPGVAVGNKARIRTKGGAARSRRARRWRLRHRAGLRPREWRRLHRRGQLVRAVREAPGILGRTPRATPEGAAQDSPRPRPEGDVVERARRYLAAIPVPVIGEGSDAATLSAACRLVRGFALTEAEAGSLLWEWAGGRPGWTREWVERKVANALPTVTSRWAASDDGGPLPAAVPDVDQWEEEAGKFDEPDEGPMAGEPEDNGSEPKETRAEQRTDGQANVRTSWTAEPSAICAASRLGWTCKGNTMRPWSPLAAGGWPKRVSPG